jgi:hypothetical protein
MVPSASILSRRQRLIASISAAQLTFALIQFEEKHGKLPPALTSLEAHYFPGALPRDPFNGQLFHYKRAERLIYSVGKNQRDNKGDDAIDYPFNIPK